MAMSLFSPSSFLIPRAIMKANRNPFSLVTRFSAAFFLSASLSASLELMSAIDCCHRQYRESSFPSERPDARSSCIDCDAAVDLDFAKALDAAISTLKQQ